MMSAVFEIGAEQICDVRLLGWSWVDPSPFERSLGASATEGVPDWVLDPGGPECRFDLSVLHVRRPFDGVATWSTFEPVPSARAAAVEAVGRWDHQGRFSLGDDWEIDSPGLVATTENGELVIAERSIFAAGDEPFLLRIWLLAHGSTTKSCRDFCATVVGDPNREYPTTTLAKAAFDMPDSTGSMGVPLDGEGPPMVGGPAVPSSGLWVWPDSRIG